MSIIPDRMARISRLTEPSKLIRDTVLNGYQRGLYPVSGTITTKDFSSTDIPSPSYDTEFSSTGLSLLRLLTSRLEGLTFAEVSTVVGIDPVDLREILHQKTPLELVIYDRIERLFRLTERLRSLMQHRVIGWWYRTSDPELNGQSPLELLKDNRIADLERVVDSYFDTAYT